MLGGGLTPETFLRIAQHSAVSLGMPLFDWQNSFNSSSAGIGKTDFV
jgi:hypothetical protein